MDWPKWVVISLAVVEAGWMIFDGSRALVLGDYLTAKAGPHKGQLGPWAKVVSAVGIEPRSTVMKSAFVAYGVGWLIVTGAYGFGFPWAWLMMLFAAAGSLRYLPLGTSLGGIQLAILLLGGGCLPGH
jgi:hypothetical protein